MSIQKYYDSTYHEGKRDEELLLDYSLNERLGFFQNMINKNDRVLDYGCGSGAILTGLKGIDSVHSAGVDISESAISFCKKIFPLYNWNRVDVDERLPFDDSQFDVVISSEVIEHVFDVDNFLSEMRRVLKRNGFIGLSCPFHGWLKNIVMLFTGHFENHYHNPYDPHIRYYTVNGINKVLGKNGFKVQEIAPICPYLGIRSLARMMAIRAVVIK